MHSGIKFRLAVIFHICVLVTGCVSPANSSLWGVPITATPSPKPIPSATFAPPAVATASSPTITPTATIGITRTPFVSLPFSTVDSNSTTPLATLPPINTGGPMDPYLSQSGDTLEVLERRFDVSSSLFQSPVILPEPGSLLAPGTLILIPKRETEWERTSGDILFPDSEFVNGPSTLQFSTTDYINAKNGHLKTYREYVLSGGWLTGAEAVQRLADENSISPRVLLAVIEYESNWVLGNPTNFSEDEYPLGYRDYLYRRLFRQLMWASGELSKGYYSWRSGHLKELTFQDGSKIRINPMLNAGTVAIQYYLSLTHSREEWERAITSGDFSSMYNQMFGSPFSRSSIFEPTIPAGLQQPPLSLPYEKNKIWAYTSGPHSAWEKEGALAALDFAPGANEGGCVETDAWVLAPADGTVVRTEPGVVMLDLDSDGSEKTGWVLLFLHIATKDKVKIGDKLLKDDKIGHPSCEGGVSTGTHLHFARKFNGEWMLADGPVPFNLDGWIAHNGPYPYKGTLTKGDKEITSCTCSDYNTNIIRE